MPLRAAGTALLTPSAAFAACSGGVGPAFFGPALLRGHHNVHFAGFSRVFNKLCDIFGRVSVFLQPKQGVSPMTPIITLGLWNRRRKLANGKT